ncbi:MAG: 2TM domain-containing protein [Acidimicrobiales bacterium]|jgi:hypothetical protein|nr:2TM domain-containing protein [Acidimicrobiales bacterium]
MSDTSVVTTPDERREAAIARIKSRREFWQHLAAYVIINAFLVLIWAASGGGYFWPIWVIGGWGIGLAFHAWDTFGQKPITEEQIQREMEREAE